MELAGPIRIALLPLCFAGMAGCGASITAVYEGDVRFEHCIALDTRSDVRKEARRACWEEWAKFYTFGQTRDRVEYARVRQRELADDSNVGDRPLVPERPTPLAVPEPTTALAPPPMMLQSDASAAAANGITPPSVASAASAPSVSPPNAPCAGACEVSWSACREECRTPACDKTCTAKYSRCMRRCF